MRDLTKGNVTKSILHFAFPIFAANVLQLTYSFTDTRMVGEFLGEEALAAVGLTNPLNTLVVGLLIGVTNGFSVITARYFGAGDKKGLLRSVAASYVLGIPAALMFTFAAIYFLDPLLVFLNTPAGLFDRAYRYISIIFAGMFISLFYNVCTGILRAIGDTLTPLIFLAVSAVLNIAGDYLCLGVWHMDVEGAAYATLASQFIAAVVCTVYSFGRYDCIRFKACHCRTDKKLAKIMLESGASMGFMNSIVSLGTVALQGAINTFGPDIIVAHSAARKITELFMMAFGVFGMTMSVFCGQNIGAGRYSRVRKGLKNCILMTFVWCIGTMTAAWAAGPGLIHMVTGSNIDAVLETGALYLRVDTLFYFVPAMISVIRNSMQGIGDHITPIFSSIIELAGKILIAALMAPRFGYWAVIIAEPVVWVLMVIPLIVNILRSPVIRQPDR